MRPLVKLMAGPALATLLGGCAQTSKVADGIDAGQLAQGRRAVAVMKVGSTEGVCHSVRVTLARAEGAAYRETRALTVTAPTRLDEPTVAEAELDAGEHHVVAFACSTQKGVLTVAGRREGDLHAKSLAAFSLAPGEIVNVGYLRMTPVGRRVPLSSKYEVGVAVQDWPIGELERYAKARPRIYGAMKTRLMTVPNDAGRAPDCRAMRQLQAEGKLQNLPADCQSTGKPGA